MPLTRINGTQIADNSITAEDIVYSLDDAYDNGGSGVGRTITADAGPLIIDSSGNLALELTGTLRASSTITAGVNLESRYSAGDEGGEIFLNKPVTNTTLTNGVTIDVYQNKLRFFEDGGTARGYYIDITNGAAGASTNLVGTGGGTPGGSDTQVQFNDGGTSFGGDAGLTYNKTTDSLTVAGDLAVNGGDITTTAATFNLINDTTTALNVGGAATAITMGDASTATTTIRGGTLVGNTATQNVFNATATTVNFAGGASSVNIGSASSVTSIANDLNIGGGGSKLRFGTSQQFQILWNTNTALTNTSGQFLLQQKALDARLELQTTGSTNAGMFRIRNLIGPVASQTSRDLFEVRNDGTIMIGSSSSGASFLGSTTVMNDLFLASGIVAVSTDTTPIQLISSGNVTVKLDVNNNGAGHYFAIQDYNGADQFRVSETGFAQVTQNLVVTGTIESLALVKAPALTGSLTKLNSGGDYLVAGSSISLTTGSSGEVTIASTTTPSYVTSLTWLVG